MQSLNVSDDCKDIDTGVKVEKDDWRITSIDGEHANITGVGGKNNRINLKDIIYPNTTKIAH